MDFFFNVLNFTSHNVVLTSTQPLTEMVISDLPGEGGEGRPVRNADNLTVICEPISIKYTWVF
jgi:hypothetical protein